MKLPKSQEAYQERSQTMKVGDIVYKSGYEFEIQQIDGDRVYLVATANRRNNYIYGLIYERGWWRV